SERRTPMMNNEWKARETICEVGRRLYNRGFAAANDGNISIRLEKERFLCTPTGVSKGFMKPDDLCIVDLDGKQMAGSKKRTSEILLHLAVYREREDIGGVVHCHPPHATAFAVVHEAIPKCVLPEVEVFLGEVPIARYETPGDDRFAKTVVPFVHDANTVLLANHGTLAFAPELMTAYFNTEIIDAYCRILILAKQLGPIKYISEQKTKELLDLRARLGMPVDPRQKYDDCDLCGNSVFRTGYDSFVPQSTAFPPPATERLACSPASPLKNAAAAAPVTAAAAVPPLPADMEALVRVITDQVLRALAHK
ncbi:MAG: class II aldolase/adducin family protein, partial [Planctomycetia bacterium]